MTTAAEGSFVSLIRRVARHLTVTALAAATLLSGVPAPTQAVDGSSFLAEVNQQRSEAGRSPVRLDAVIDRIAVERGHQLAADRALGHDFEYIKRRLNEARVCWEWVGEVVAQNGSGQVSQFVQQWMDSPPHREIMLNARYSVGGGSWSRDGSGTAYAAMILIDPCGSQPIAGFTDIGASQFRGDIAWLVDAGITAGCAPDRYCPRNVVTREQMASFLRRATNVPSASRDWFRDDDASAHEGDINRVAEASIAAGCADARYCPQDRVSRGQMASFLARALGLRGATRDWFRDDNGTTHESDINRLAEADITGGCAPGRFCADAAVTREQMAALLHRAFDG